MRNRKQVIDHIAEQKFDVCVIGGGATGSACALESQLRGLKTVMLEAGDFASGSSTASTKMAHGGVRYLQEAITDLDIDQYHLVEAALRERALMLHNAPHLTRTLEYLVPCFSHFDRFYYGLGMKMYDWISGKASLLPSRLLTREEALFRMPAMQSNKLAGAVSYADGQFDDGRYCLALVDTFDGVGGAALNYARVTALEKTPEGRIIAAVVTDQVSKRSFQIVARSFVNATGPFSDVMRNLASADAGSRMRPSKGVHILFPLDDFSENDALLVPRTEDGRVIFAVPVEWTPAGRHHRYRLHAGRRDGGDAGRNRVPPAAAQSVPEFAAARRSGGQRLRRSSSAGGGAGRHRHQETHPRRRGGVRCEERPDQHTRR